jgi:hypothetical protein
MRMQLEARQVGHPHERRRVARHDFFGNPAGWKAQRYDVNPIGSRCRRALLKEEFAIDAIGIPDEHIGPPAGRTQGPLGDGEIVASEIELRVASLRKEHFAGFEITMSRPATVTISRPVLSCIHLLYSTKNRKQEITRSEEVVFFYL